MNADLASFADSDEWLKHDRALQCGRALGFLPDHGTGEYFYILSTLDAWVEGNVRMNDRVGPHDYIGSYDREISDIYARSEAVRVDGCVRAYRGQVRPPSNLLNLPERLFISVRGVTEFFWCPGGGLKSFRRRRPSG